ncbi:MAG: thymidylate synthase [Candidatus Geothermarchaeales archaeon]
MNYALPVLVVNERTVPEAWEKSIKKLWENGIEIKTEYDKAEDPPSKDCTMVMAVREPMAEPRIHLFSMGIDLKGLAEYREEILSGSLDHWVEEGKLSYTYHERLFDYTFEPKTSKRSRGIDQINRMIKKLSEVPYSRRAQAITWNPSLDTETDSPPCLQRLWGRCFRAEDGRLYFNMNTHWRSRDAYKAAFANMFGITELQKMIADGIAETRGEEVLVGQYTDISDSYHIYGRDREDVENRFLKNLSRRSYYDDSIVKSRTLRSDSKIFQNIVEEIKKRNI